MITLFDPAHILAYAVAFMLIGTFVMLFYMAIIYYREQDATREGITKNAQLASVMRACNIRIWLMNCLTSRYAMLSDDGTEQETYMPLEFSQLYQHDDFAIMRQRTLDIRDRKIKEATCRVRGRRQSDNSRRTYEVNIRVLNSDSSGRPTTIIGLQREITQKLKQQENVNKLLSLYHTFFDSSIIDMMYYDKNGVLIEINNKACETFGVKDREAVLERGLNILTMPAYAGLDIKNVEGYRMTAVTDIDKYRQKFGVHIPEVSLKGKIYYDTIMNPIFDKDGHIEGIYTAGHSINETVDSYHRQQESTRTLRETTRQIQNYIDNINMALRVSEVRLVNYHPDTHELEISNDLNTERLMLTQVRCMRLVAFEFRNQVGPLLRKMDRRENTRIDLTTRTFIKDKKGREVWLTFNIIPMVRADGTVDHYFGMCRNETDMVETAAALKEESLKAQETELLKDTFLQNMSHEIRTPLSAVIGFAELLSMDHPAEEEPLFITQIKKNSNLLLQLVNDVLFISRLDAHMVDIKKQPSDFAMLFEGWCHLGWSSHRPEVSVSVENPYEHLVIDIDDTNLSTVIQRLCSNSASTTHEGYIRSRYEYRHGMLVIGIEDSSPGYDQESVKRAFDRFVRDSKGEYSGTGLSLPIVKELTEQMGGIIDFQSEPGKGCTVWVSIPCTAMSSEKKDIITV